MTHKKTSAPQSSLSDPGERAGESQPVPSEPPMPQSEREFLHQIIEDANVWIDPETHPELAARIYRALFPCDDAGTGRCVPMAEPVVYVVIDIGCHECGVDHEVVQVCGTKAEAEAAAETRDAETNGWRDGGQTVATVFKVPFPTWPDATKEQP